MVSAGSAMEPHPLNAAAGSQPASGHSPLKDSAVGSVHSFVEVELPSHDDALCVEVGDQDLENAIFRGIPASLLVAHYWRQCASRQCSQHGANPESESPMPWWQDKTNDMFDFVAACRNVLSALKKTSDEGLTIRAALRVECPGLLSGDGCMSGRVTLRLQSFKA